MVKAPAGTVGVAEAFGQLKPQELLLSSFRPALGAVLGWLVQRKGSSEYKVNEN